MLEPIDPAPTNDLPLGRAAAFLDGHARLLERRLFETAFREGDPRDAVAAVLAYRNPDGGFGHALEPDLRVSTSQPVFVHFALSALREAGAGHLPDAHETCAFLASVADDAGALPYVLPDSMAHARAGHWQGAYALEPSLHATTGVIAGLHALEVEHPWLEAATAWSLEQIRGTPAYTGHRILNVLDLLHNVADLPDREALVAHVTARLFEQDYVQMDVAATGYGLTPLHFAPSPDAPSRALFEGAVIEAHLDRLAARQQPDGGWPITWAPPPGAATNEWRGRWTLEALTTLQAYGRL